MAKSQKNQTFVLKINTGYLSRHDWNLTLKLNEIRKQSQMVVSLGSSQVLRWMDQAPERKNNDIEATAIKQEIKYIKKQEKELAPNNKCPIAFIGFIIVPRLPAHIAVFCVLI